MQNSYKLNLGAKWFTSANDVGAGYISSSVLMMGVSMYVYQAKIVLEGENIAIEVAINANDPFQARRIIERIYGPVKLWVTVPQ